MKSLEQFVEEDHRIEKSAENATLRLMEHRHRAVQQFGVRPYARAVGVAESTIRKYARAWELWPDASAGRRTPADVLEMASRGADSYVAAEAVAEAKGITVKTARESYPTEVKRVREAVADAPPEERPAKAHVVARQIETTRQGQKAHRDQRRAKLDTAYIDLEREVDKARRALTNALAIARESTLDDECIALVKDSLDKTRALMGLIDLAVTGTLDVDWDTEMRKVIASET